MFEATLTADTKAELYLELLAAIDALTSGEPDPIANMANAAALIGQTLPDLNWAGFYRLIDGELVLGPFMGKPACIRIAMGQGVCGTAAEVQTLVRVDDVHEFPGHIACDAGVAVRTGRADCSRRSPDRGARSRQPLARALR